MNGRADLCFFPVDNKLGRKDPTMKKLLKVIEAKIDESDYVHAEQPLSWLQALDLLTAKQKPFLRYETEVLPIMVNTQPDGE